MSEKLYKVLKGDQSCHGGTQTWPLPTADSPGEWLEYAGPLSPCSRGYHVTNDPAKWYDRDGLSVYEVEYEGEIARCSDDKSVVRKLRLTRQAAPADLERFGIYTVGTHKVSCGKIFASGSASVEASGSASVRAFGSASVRASGSASVRAFDSASVRASGSASVRAFDSASVRASGSASVEAFDSASVEAFGSASVQSFSPSVKAQLSGLAVLQDRSQYGKVTIRVAEGAAVTLESAKS